MPLIPALKLIVGAGLLALSSACATTTTVELPSLNAAKTSSASALLVAARPGTADLRSKQIVKGSGQGALRGMGNYFSTGRGGNGGVMLLFAPIFLPMFAVGGAASAHSSAEVNRALDAVDAVAQDTALMQSIDRRFVAALDGTTADTWSCLAAASTSDGPPCADHTPLARLELRPSFRIEERGDYDPDIHLFGEVSAVVSEGPTAAGKTSRPLLQAKWQLHAKAGRFLALARNDAALLRRTIEAYLERFAREIARDLYLEPRRQTVTKRKEPLNSPRPVVPPNVVTRVE